MSRTGFLESVDNFALLRMELHNEIHGATKVGPVFTENGARRVLVRSCFAYIEGVLYAFKQVLLSYDRIVEFLNDGERALMAEVAFDVKNNGEADIKNAHLRLADNIRFAFRMWNRIMPEPKSEPDYAAQEWCKLREAITLRNRVTHPKSPDDLAVSDDEFHALEVGYRWFVNLTSVSVAPLRTLAAQMMVDETGHQ